MQYVKFITENQVQYPPKNYTTEDGTTIFNFDKNEDALKANGFKELVITNRENGRSYKVTYKETDSQVIEILEDITKEIEEETEAARKEEIQKCSLTKREVFLALYKDKKVTPEQLRAQVTDPEALIEFDYAERYYRGNPLINNIGAMLGYSEDDLDCLFQNGEFPKEEPQEAEETIS